MIVSLGRKWFKTWNERGKKKITDLINVIKKDFQTNSSKVDQILWNTPFLNLMFNI